ncbi:MAG: hypothetical protein IM600_01655 [Bacteroidetes bacterium]|jgi:spore germination protein YaaH|nr:hypothetical protein [Bacteroidota bacterium]MCA6442110.1 hypothetical protein [Bacteroidota bacterium]
MNFNFVEKITIMLIKWIKLVAVKMQKMKRLHKLFFIFISLCISTTHTFIYAQEKADSITSHDFFLNIKDSVKKYFHSTHLLTNNHIQLKKTSDSSKLKPIVKIFGWHTYWMKNAYINYNYSLLTHVSYFSSKIDPSTGNIEYNGWDTTSFVNYVKKQNPLCKVILNVTCFGASPIKTFLNNSNAQSNFIKTILSNVISKKADGICIDFEGIPYSAKASFSNFISNLKSTFKQNGLLVYITLPAVDSDSSPFDFNALLKSVDLFIIMGYDYFGSFSKITGPIAPLKSSPNWITNQIESSTEYYLKNIPDSLLLLGVAYYGAIWETDDENIPSNVLSFAGYRSYGYALSMLDRFKNDTVINSSYYIFPYDKGKYRQFWLDGVYSLGKKYDLVLNKKLGGIAIWALGFDEGSNNLWDLIENKFTSTKSYSVTSQPLPVITPTNSPLITKIIVLAKSKPYLFGLSVFLMLLTLLILLLKVVSTKDNIPKLKSTGLYYLLLFVMVILILSLILSIYFFCFYSTDSSNNLKNTLLFFIPLVCITGLVIFLKIWKNQRDKIMP